MTTPVANEKYTDRFGDKIFLGKNFILYRNRSIPFTEIKEIRAKNGRLMINHFKANTSHPTMCILFETKNKAEWFHDEIMNVLYH